jgi:hypothetical protein
MQSRAGTRRIASQRLGAGLRPCLLCARQLPTESFQSPKQRAKPCDGDRRLHTAGHCHIRADIHTAQVDLRDQSARSSRSALAITMIDAPVSATIAIQSVATPATAATTNAAFMTIEMARFILMLRTVARLRRNV